MTIRLDESWNILEEVILAQWLKHPLSKIQIMSSNYHESIIEII